MAETLTTADNTPLVELYRTTRAKTDPKYIKLLNNKLLFKLFLMGELPMGFLAGLKVKHVDAESCQINVPYKWLNKNPFRSTYFAVLAMAAEMSTGMLAMMFTKESNPSVSMLVTHLEADFVKKATGITTFTCKQGKEINAIIEKAILTGEGQNIVTESIGTNAKGEVEARFLVQWSFKMRKQK